LKELRELLIGHPAFSPTKKLSSLAEKYGIKIIFRPKYHCELNPIEGEWCNQKAFIRKRTNQTFLRLITLLNESRSHFIQNELFK
jgi:transposase